MPANQRSKTSPKTGRLALVATVFLAFLMATSALVAAAKPATTPGPPEDAGLPNVFFAVPLVAGEHADAMLHRTGSAKDPLTVHLIATDGAADYGAYEVAFDADAHVMAPIIEASCLVQ